MADAETEVRIGIRVVGKEIVVDVNAAFVLPGYHVVWDVCLAPNERITIQFKKKSPFKQRLRHPNNPKNGVYRRYNTGAIVTGPAIDKEGDYYYSVFYEARDPETNKVIRSAEVDPMIKI
jgi:hypothetical protein